MIVACPAGRVIDLLAATALRLAIIRDGVAPVHLEVVGQV
jgi:rare lipoprotein A (peptidoglycan hydrolase)